MRHKAHAVAHGAVLMPVIVVLAAACLLSSKGACHTLALVSLSWRFFIFSYTDRFELYNMVFCVNTLYLKKKYILYK